MIKARPWNGKDLKGTWEVTLKIDGVRALWTSVEKGGREWLSRAGKVLYNIPPPPHIYKDFDCEVYLGNFKDTIRATRTQTAKVTGCKLKKCKCASALDYTPLTAIETRVGGMVCPSWVEATPVIKPEHLYSLYPLDARLGFKNVSTVTDYDTVTNPDAKKIRAMLKVANRMGYEGLVLRSVKAIKGARGFEAVWLKVKPEETHDVLVTGAIEGVGKHKGRLGALMTAKGKVGTGFSDEEREDLWEWYQRGYLPGHPGQLLTGQTIEVSCMHFTPDGMFRHPRFIRMRPDKVADQ